MPKPSANTQKLTNRTVEAAAPRDKLYRINDETQPGLCLAVHPSGRKSFRVRYVTAEGKNSEKTLGDYPGLLPLPARDLAAKMRSEVRTQGADPAEAARATRKVGTQRRERTLKALFEAYLKDVEARGQKRSSTLAKEKQYLNKTLTPRLGHLKADEVTALDVSKHLAEIKAAASKPGKDGIAAANDCRKYLRLAFEHGRKLGWMTTNIVNDVDKYATTSRERVASDAELKALWGHWEAKREAEDPRSWSSAAALQLACLTLQRGDEVCSMPWGEVDLETKTWTIPANRKKEKRSAVVPLSDEAVAILKEAKARFPDAAGPFPGRKEGLLRRGSLTQACKRDCEDLGIDNITPHDLRRTGRTAITNPEALGFPPHIGEAVISHAVGNTLTRTYDRNTYLSEKRNALDAWGREVMRIASGEGRVSNVVKFGSQQAKR